MMALALNWISSCHGPNPFAASAAVVGLIAGWMRNPSLLSLEIFATTAEIIGHGLPVDRLELVKIMAHDIPLAWRNMLFAHAAELVDVNIDR